jgi:hypothetical protein
LRDGNDVALMFVAHEEGQFGFYVELFVGQFEADVLLFGVEKGLEGGGDFNEVVEGKGFGVGRCEELEELGGEECRNAAGYAMVTGMAETTGLFGEGLGVEEGAVFDEPLLVAGMTPVIEVLAVHQLASEMGVEDGFDGGELVKPGEEVVAGVAVTEALVEMLTDFVGKTGDFTGAKMHSFRGI